MIPQGRNGDFAQELFSFLDGGAGALSGEEFRVLEVRESFL